MRAVESLNYIGAIDKNYEMTSIGSKICEYPLEPQHAFILIESIKQGICEEVCKILSLVNVPNIFMRPRKEEKIYEAETCKRKFQDPSGDHLTLLNV